MLPDSATVKDLIGLAFWKYNEGRKDPIKFVSALCVQHVMYWTLLIEIHHEVHS